MSVKTAANQFIAAVLACYVVSPVWAAEQQYDEGQQASIFQGTLGMAEKATDTAVPLQANSVGDLKVTLDGEVVTVDSELPAAAVLADDTANPTTTSVGTFPHWFDGVTWDRARGDSTNGAFVNLKATDLDLMLGTDFSAVFGAATLLTTTQADNLANTTDTANVSSFLYGFDGTAWDRLNVNSAGDLKVTLDSETVTITGSIGAAHIDDASFTPATDDGTPAFGFFDDVAPDSVDEGDAGAVRMTAHRALHVVLRDPTGERAASVRDLTNDALNVAIVDASGDQITSFGVSKNEDTAHGDGDAGTPAWAVRDDTLNARSGAENDYEPLHTNADGALWNVDINSSAIAASLSVLDDWDETNRAAVNLIAGQVGVQGGAGASTALTQRVAIATDANTVDTELTTADLDTGAGTDTQAVVGLSLSKSGGSARVGAGADGDPVPVSDDGGALTVDWAGTAPPIGAGTEAAALRITVATDSTGVLSVDDNGATLSVDDGAGSLTVDGTVDVSDAFALDTSVDGVEGLLTTIDADTGNIATQTADLPNVIGTDGAAGPTKAVSVAGTDPLGNLQEVSTDTNGRVNVNVVDALPAGTNAIGKLAANSGVDIGDVDVTSVIPGTGATNLGKAEDVAHASGDTGVAVLVAYRAWPTLSQTAGTAADYSVLANDDSGRLLTSNSRNLSATTTFHDAVRLDDSPTEATSSSVDLSLYSRGRLYYTIDSTSTPTDVRIEVQYSDDNSTFYAVQEWYWGDLRYEDTATATAINHCVAFPEPLGQYCKIRIVGTGTTAGAYFDVTVKGEFYTQ